MNSLQNVEVLKKYDLIVVEDSGVRHLWRPAVFIRASMEQNTCITVHYILINHPYNAASDHIYKINTRNSKQRRVYQITKETLAPRDFEWYNDFLLTIEKNDNRN